MVSWEVHIVQRPKNHLFAIDVTFVKPNSFMDRSFSNGSLDPLSTLLQSPEVCSSAMIARLDIAATGSKRRES